MKILIVGAGLYGSTCARELTDQGYQVTVIDKRNHIGGNVYTQYNEQAQCHEHVYGPHIFHTNSVDIWNYVNKFTEFRPYFHRVKAKAKDTVYSFPVNLLTIQQIFALTDVELAKLAIEKDCDKTIDPNKNLENYCLATFGKTLYELFFRGYTEKQWNTNPNNLPASIAKRIPIRFNFNDQYFDDQFQGIPINGYTDLIKNMLGTIPIELDVDFLVDKNYWLTKFDHIIYTGQIDQFFDYSFGQLGYRSLKFEREIKNLEDYQGCPIINYCDQDIPWTRIVEHKHFQLKNKSNYTLITKEYPADYTAEAIPYYPINNDENQSKYNRYINEAKRFSNIHFGGRLGSYIYYDMHQVIAAALKYSKDFTKNKQ